MTRIHLRPSLLSLLPLLLLTALPLGCPPSGPGKTSTDLASALPPDAKVTLLTDFSDDLPEDDRNATLSLTFVDIRPLRGDAAGNVTVQIERRDGAWAQNKHSASADYNQKSKNDVTLKDVTWDGRTVKGTVHVTIGWDHPRSAREKGFPNPPDEYVIEFSADLGGFDVGFQPDIEAFLPSYRKDTPTYGGTVLAGSYTARRKGETTKGTVTGAVNAAPVAGRFGARNNVRITKADGGGMHVVARLSPKRVAPPSNAWAMMQFEKPRDFSDYDGLRITVASDKPRDDAAVAVGLAEEDGGFYSVTSAATLTGDERSFVVPFADFRGGSDNYHFDRAQIGTIFLGVDNPHGVGDVAFTVRKVELYRLPQNSGEEATGPVTVRVYPDNELDVGGTTEVPKGLFGFHDVYANKPRTPEGKPGPEEYMRRLNPGYLRPLDHVGFSGRGVGAEADKSHAIGNTRRTIAEGSPFWRRAVAADAIDNVVYCHTMDLWNRPVWMDKPIDKIAEEVEAFYRALGRVGWRPGDRSNPLRRLEVWNEPFMWGRHVNMGFRNPSGRKSWTDPTQHGYIPGKLGADMYSTIFEAAVRGAKSANKHILLGGPCSPGMNGDDYATFTNYVQRFIDRCHDKVDFLVEHHYFGNPAAYPASYIVATAYLDVRHGRRVPIYNTECNDLSDNAARRAHYNIAEILHAVRLCPDILKGRAVHALWSGYLRNAGEEHAYKLLAPLRGQMLRCEAFGGKGLIAAATRGKDERVTVVVHNESGQPRSLKLADFGKVQGRVVLRVSGKETSLETADGSGLDTVRLGHMETVRWTVEAADGKKPGVVNRRTHYADVLFQRVKPGQSVTGKVHWRGKPGSYTATLRVITRDVHRGEAWAILDGKRIPLPWSSSNDGQAVVQDIFIPRLKDRIDSIRFECSDAAAANGFTVYACGIVTE